MTATQSAYALLSEKLDEIRSEANCGIHGRSASESCVKIHGLVYQAQILLRENLVLCEQERDTQGAY